MPVSLFCFVVQKGVFDLAVQNTIRKIQYIFRQEGSNFSKFCFVITHVDVGSSQNADEQEEEKDDDDDDDDDDDTNEEDDLANQTYAYE